MVWQGSSREDGSRGPSRPASRFRNTDCIIHAPSPSSSSSATRTIDPRAHLNDSDAHRYPTAVSCDLLLLIVTPHRAVRDSTPSQATAARSTNRRAKLEVPTSLLISRLHANLDNTSRRTRRPVHTSPPRPYSSSPASLQLPPRRPWSSDQPDRQAPRRSLSNHSTSQANTRRHAGRQPYARPCVYR